MLAYVILQYEVAAPTQLNGWLLINETHDLIHDGLNMFSETRSDHFCLGKARPYTIQTSPDVSSDSEA